MFRALFNRLWLAALSSALAVPAWAQDTVCPDGESCVAAFRWGAWGMIVMGLLFFVVWLLPETGPREDESGNAGLPLLGPLQARLAKETTGWRRWQWPVLGVFFLGLGIAALAG